jgi:hypothetical protein
MLVACFQVWFNQINFQSLFLEVQSSLLELTLMTSTNVLVVIQVVSPKAEGIGFPYFRSYRFLREGLIVKIMYLPIIQVQGNSILSIKQDQAIEKGSEAGISLG